MFCQLQLCGNTRGLHIVDTMSVRRPKQKNWRNCWFTSYMASLTSTPGRRWSRSDVTYAEVSWEETSAVNAAVGKLANEIRKSGSDGTRVSPSSTGAGDCRASENSCCPHGDEDKICHSQVTTSEICTSLLYVAIRVGNLWGTTTGVGGSSRPNQPQIQPTHQYRQDQGMASDGIACRIFIGTGEYVPIPWVSDYGRWWVYDRIPYQVK